MVATYPTTMSTPSHHQHSAAGMGQPGRLYGTADHATAGGHYKQGPQLPRQRPATQPAPQPGPPPPSSSGPTQPHAPIGQPRPAPSADGPPVPSPAERSARWEADLRTQVAHRLWEMNVLHARNAWFMRRSDPIAPHVLAFFYAEPPDPAVGGYQLRTAGRQFPDGPEVEDAARLLYELCTIADGYIRAGAFNPRAQMADAHNVDAMSANAMFIGIGLSTLDTPWDGPWREVKRHAAGELAVTGRCWAWLTDDTAVVVDRYQHHRVPNLVISSNRQLTLSWDDRLREYRALPDDPGVDDDTREMWTWLTRLGRLASSAQHHPQTR